MDTNASPRSSALPWIIAALVILLLLTPLLLALLATAILTPTTCPSGGAVVGDQSTAALSATQRDNAATIAARGLKAGVGERGVIVALAAALQESRLQNLDHGDRDSLGLFQQRPTQGWGTPAQIQNPVLASDAFYGTATHTSNPGLLDITGWELLPITVAAQRVQRSGFPDAYAQWESQATALARELLTPARPAPIDPGTDSAVDTVADRQPAPRQDGAGESIYQLGPVQPQTAHVADLLGPMFGIRTIGGWRPSDSVDPNGHPAGLALDFMTNDIPNGTATGNALADYIVTHASELGVKYVIWRQKIWNPLRANEGWRPMEDRGNATANHFDHVHLSLTGTTTTVGALATGCVPAQAPPPGGTPQPSTNRVPSGPTFLSAWSTASPIVVKPPREFGRVNMIN